MGEAPPTEGINTLVWREGEPGTSQKLNNNNDG